MELRKQCGPAIQAFNVLHSRAVDVQLLSSFQTALKVGQHRRKSLLGNLACIHDRRVQELQLLARMMGGLARLLLLQRVSDGRRGWEGFSRARCKEGVRGMQGGR